MQIEKLTDREKQVAAHLAAGLRVAGVATELGLSENTVRNHLKRALSKLDVHSQSELIDFVRRHPTMISPYQSVAGSASGAEGDLLDELAEVDRATEKRIDEAARSGSGLERMQKVLRAVLPLDEERRREWRVRLAAHVVGPQQREVRDATSEIHRKWRSRPLRRIEEFRTRGWVRDDLADEDVRQRLFSAVYASALALLANPATEEQERQLAAIDHLLAEIAAPEADG